MEGWIKLHRSLLDWEWWDDNYTLKAWIYILLKANHEDVPYMGSVVKRGELTTSIRRLSENFGCCNATTLKILKRLEEGGQITVNSERKFTRITICNYDSYQDLSEIVRTQSETQSRTQNETQGRTEGRTQSEQKVDTNNNVKNEKNNNIVVDAEMLPVGKISNFLLEGGTEWKEHAARSLQVGLNDLPGLFDAFQSELIAQGIESELVRDVKSHFINLIRIKLKDRKNGQRTNKPSNDFDPRELVNLVNNVIETEKKLYER